MATTSRSQVQVSITGKIAAGFRQAFTSADKQMTDYGRTVAATSKKVGDVTAYRQQQNAVRETGRAWKEAKDKAEALRRELAATANPTRQQTAALDRSAKTARAAGAAYTEARTRLGGMSRELQRNGVDVSRLSSEYRRLQAEQTRATAGHARAEGSLRRQAALVRGMGAAWRAAQGTAVGGVAAGMVLQRPLAKAMTYDQQMTYMADTAGNDKTVGERQALKIELGNDVAAALKFGGGKREDVAGAMNTLIASGKFEGRTAAQALPDVARTAFASGAEADDIAKTAIALKNFGITNIGAEFDKMLKAGQLGSFELKDMAKFLPQQLALARGAGYSGPQGVTDLLAFNQVATQTAGTKDEAGNNVVNLLQKFSSRELSETLAKVVKPAKGDPTVTDKKGQKDFDWSGFAMSRRGQGVGMIESFGEVLDRQMAADPKYRAMQAKMAKPGNDAERRATLDAMGSIAEGSAIGKILADRQALMAALAAFYGKKDMAKLKGEIGNASGTVNQSSQFVRDQPWAKAIDSQNIVARANEQVYNEAAGPLGKVITTANNLAEEFPRVTTAAYGAATALGAVAAFAAAGGAFRMFTQGGAGAAAAAAAAQGGAAGAGAAGAATAGVGLGAIARGVMGGVAGAAMLPTMTSGAEDRQTDAMSAREREQMTALRARYGTDTLAAAYKQRAPWYNFGGVDQQRPEKLEQWVKEYQANPAGDQGARVRPAAPGAGGRTIGSMWGETPKVQQYTGPSAIPGGGTGGPTTAAAALAATSNAAAVQAAQAATTSMAALTAIQARPNVTLSPSYTITLNVADTKDAQDLSNVLRRELDRRDRDAQADLRSSYFSSPQY